MPLKFLALGDSYTVGEGVEREDSWPHQLVRRLRGRGLHLEEPEVIATTGWTTRELLKGIEDRRPLGPFGLVTLLIGVNNQYRGLDLDEYANEFKELLDLAIGFADGARERIYVLSIPDWSVTPFAEGRDREAITFDIDRFNAVAARIAEEAGVKFIDITGISRQAAFDRSLLASDGLHPSGAMYKRWVDLLESQLKLVLYSENPHGQHHS